MARFAETSQMDNPINLIYYCCCIIGLGGINQAFARETAPSCSVTIETPIRRIKHQPSHSLNALGLDLEFHASFALMLLIQSSLRLPCIWTDAKGYRLALMVT